MSQGKWKKGRAFLMAAALLSGGLLPSTCMIRTKQALVDGSKSFLANVLLNPANFTDAFLDSSQDETTTEGE